MFDAVASTYNANCVESLIGQYQRTQVWRWLDPLCSAQHSGPVLELGCGTGVDAVHLAQRGCSVLATDPSPAMIQATNQRIQAAGYTDRIQTRCLGLEDLASVTGSFSGGFSNFSPFNCVPDLAPVAQHLGRLLMPDAPLVVVIFGRWCLWELLAYGIRGQWTKATRRQQRVLEVPLGGGVTVTTYYHTVPQVLKALHPWFDLEQRVGIGVVVPPMYLEAWAKRHQYFLNGAQKLDLALGGIWPYALAGDHTLLILRRR